MLVVYLNVAFLPFSCLWSITLQKLKITWFLTAIRHTAIHIYDKHKIQGRLNGPRCVSLIIQFIGNEYIPFSYTSTYSLLICICYSSMYDILKYTDTVRFLNDKAGSFSNLFCYLWPPNEIGTFKNNLIFL